MTEQEVAAAVVDAEKELDEAKILLTKARRAVTEAESWVISSKLTRDRAKEALRVYRNTTPKKEITRRDEEISQFQKDYPDLVEWARKRDEDK